ncbi:FAD-dependent oxidoreductase [Ferrimicrobium sp.]|uniref:dihydrolipoyl dehydrogenase family protein n=2 Tax=Ferrimicrobium sp. TaxID=2926050 RepID=UPI002607B41E|nr:FAD-dependent oxidoreductase [Ferrimicrobium sp.]
MTDVARGEDVRSPPESQPSRSSGRTVARVCDLAVIGGGAGGLAAARAGVARGLKTVLVSDAPLGGDCTFTGCVPSKTLIEAASRGDTFRQAAFRIQETIAQIAGGEDAIVLHKEGVEVVEGFARFCGSHEIVVGSQRLRAQKIVIATGSQPSIPLVPGLRSVPFLTNETVFALNALPPSIAILGGGAIGCEMAQAFRRFGVDVHLIEAESRLLAREEPEVSAVLGRCFSDAGIHLHLGQHLESIQQTMPDGPIELRMSAGKEVLRAMALLVATGRHPRTDGLELEAAGVAVDARGFVKTDSSLATTNKDVYAVGDINGRLLLTHAADEMGRVAIHNITNPLGRLGRRSFKTSSIPSVVFSDPEVARVGLTETEAVVVGGRVAYLPMSEVDRAITANRTEGFIKLIAGPRTFLRNAGGGRLLGATIVAPRAGEMIHEVALALRLGAFTGRLAQTVHAYPSWSAGTRQAAAQFFMEINGRTAFRATNRS